MAGGGGMPAVVAYVNWGRWVARCVRCPAAEVAGRNPDGTVGGLYLDRFCCSACGWAGPVRWPNNVDDIWRLLSARPDPSNRNWEPGETIHDLLAENVTHGVLPAAPDGLEGPTATVLALVDGRIVSGAELLPCPSPLAVGMR